MDSILTNLESLLRRGREYALATLRQYPKTELQAIAQFSVNLFGQTVDDSRVQDEPLLDLLAQLSIEAATSFGLDKSTSILTDYLFYQEQVGNFSKGIEIGLVAVDLAAKHGNANLQRRAHSGLGAHYARVCDFKMACHHFEISLRHARKLEDPLLECSVLSNVAALFNGMGLNRDAARVAIKAISYCDDSPRSATLRALNAINILKVSRLINDPVLGNSWYQIACKNIKDAQLQKNILLLAYFEFNRALYLIDRGKKDTASKYVDRALLKHGSTNNARVDAILQTAKALCAFASGCPADIRNAKRMLKTILHSTKESPTHYEDALRALIQVYGAENTLRGRRASLGYAQQLRQYVLDEREVGFSFQLGAAPYPGDSQTEFKFGLLTEASAVSRISALPVGTKSDLTDVYSDLTKIRRSASEERFNTGAYAVAENWALAAELSMNGSGRHCFWVGKLTGAIAFELGLDTQRCLEIEMACRLHDIGEIAINDSTFLGARGYVSEDYRSMKEHTVAGARLLGRSGDPILRVAAVVAKYHHEWWNGCGYPEGLRGEGIPIEARICAIADGYAAFTNPTCDRFAWSHEQAVQQICAMAGVQLDPNLISPFLKAVEADDAVGERVSKEVDRSMERNQLVRAKKKLFETLELVD